MLTDKFHRVDLSHCPTPLEPMANLRQRLGGPKLWVKRDDCTGLAMGGNKARQLEFYIGHALSLSADTILTTGAVQSNHVRMTVAAARKLGLNVEVQLEQRVEGRRPEYYSLGNPFLLKLMGATIHHYPVGEDEDGADQALENRAEVLRQSGHTPYVVPLSGHHTPYGALGYVHCAEELMNQANHQSVHIDAIVLASGSATTHSGLLSGLRALGRDIPVFGFCVRRNQDAQRLRVADKVRQVTEMIDHPGVVTDQDIWVDDRMFGPGYGQLNEPTLEAISLCAEQEGLLLDPTYTGKSMAGLIDLVRDGVFTPDQNIVFLHTGGTPALFGYPEILDRLDQGPA